MPAIRVKLPTRLGRCIGTISTAVMKLTIAMRITAFEKVRGPERTIRLSPMRFLVGVELNDFQHLRAIML